MSPPARRRFVRCILVVCCQKESYGDASRVLFSRHLKASKVQMCNV
jgi:hypothetical protein